MRLNGNQRLEMNVPELARQTPPEEVGLSLLVEAPRGGLLGALVTAFVRTEYPRAELRNISSELSCEVAVSAQDHDSKMIVFPSDPDPAVIARLAATGQHSIVCLGSSLEDLRTAMQRMLSGGSPFLSPSLVRILATASLRIAAGPSSTTLTQREMESVRLLALGLSNLEMANHMGVSTNTVRAHLQAISAKLGVTGRTRVIARSRELGLF